MESIRSFPPTELRKLRPSIFISQTLANIPRALQDYLFHCQQETRSKTSIPRHYDKMRFSQIFLAASLALAASCAAIPRDNNAATLNIREEASTEAASDDLSADADEATAYSLTGGWKKRAEDSTDAAESDLSADADEATAYSLTGGW